ncbi:LysR family transcriptional regulator [Agrobacterium vitis]|uniref:LysR family transcriptional regulator n=1 Tax=Agrobacterium vitis TaxID=373 RepID=A0AAE2UPQ2_AGRVI|nr:LysR family transcriptional regulator [Agrobacterium vitis]MBF2714107.1 LysR family transcriptional regulator [Agrobacterium vitis]MUO81486.1 LysR family transcriptional regulator [Agrobacterium vitis]MUO95867.1 LysR family transcriptional regulator [Agrobacterium vitis]MVA93946.1 LysR family transcriptional regulator [Agrobacterium vitis]MVB03547.1 LysR family transcriptional regulator [Agrobacterium vitis]
MKIDERHLIQLAAVVKTGGVTEGAALLGLAQPAVSRTLSSLEKRVGEPLFIKGRRPLQPTSLGLALAEHGFVMLAASRKASDLLESFRLGKSGVVRLGGTPFFMDALIAGLCAEFQASRPDVRIEQSYGYFPDLRAALKADQIDLAICPIDILEEGSGLEFQEILPGRNVVACRVTHPLLLKRRPQPSQLLDYPWVAPPPGSPLLTDLRALLLSFGATEIKIRYSGGSLMGVINYMKTADALTVMPHSVVFAQRKEKTITALPISIPHPERALAILKRIDATHSAAIDEFSTFIRSGFQNLRQLIKRHEEAVIWGV